MKYFFIFLYIVSIFTLLGMALFNRYIEYKGKISVGLTTIHIFLYMYILIYVNQISETGKMSMLLISLITIVLCEMLNMASFKRNRRLNEKPRKRLSR